MYYLVVATGVTLDMTISIGNIISSAVFIVTLYTLHKQNLKRFYAIDFKVSLMWKRFAHKFNLPEDIDDTDIT